MTIGNYQFWVSLAVGVLTGMFFIAVAPYLFRLFLPHQNDALLPQTVKELIARYIYGAGSILIGGGLAVTLMGFWWLALVFLIVAVGCGIVVVLRYFATDHAANKVQNSMQRKNNSDLR